MGEKKKVAILLPWLKMGGTNKIALHFMKELSQYCDVTLILSQNTGELLEQLPDNIRLVIDEMRSFKDIFKEDLRKLRIIKLVRDALYYARIKLKKDNVDNYRYLVRRHGNICDAEFDCAISYHGQSPERLLNLLYRVHAKKKVAWIHGEFNNSEDHYCRMNGYYDRMDHLFFISELTMNSFYERFNAAKNRCTVYYNPLDIREVLEKAEIPSEPAFSKNYKNIVTVGRISSEKGQDMIPAITRKLLDQGWKIRWYVVGDGEMRSRVEDLIQEHHVEENVILLGTKKNPYPYMKDCDIYVQPSYTEGYSTTICEAGVLGKVVVCTTNCGIRERLEPGKDAVFADATVDTLAEKIGQLLADDTLRYEYEASIRQKDFSGTGEMRKFLSIL